MVSAAGNIKNRFSVFPDRGDHGYVRKVASSRSRMIRNKYISFFQVISLYFYLISNRVAHCTEVNRNMRRIGHKFSLFIENGAGKIETFLNVGGNCGALQGASHLFSNRHKQVAEDRKLNRIQFSFNFLFGY